MNNPCVRFEFHVLLHFQISIDQHFILDLVYQLSLTYDYNSINHTFSIEIDDAKHVNFVMTPF